jgi:hypothetical protein
MSSVMLIATQELSASRAARDAMCLACRGVLQPSAGEARSPQKHHRHGVRYTRPAIPPPVASHIVRPGVKNINRVTRTIVRTGRGQYNVQGTPCTREPCRTRQFTLPYLDPGGSFWPLTS